jgi:hypothetical protein
MGSPPLVTMVIFTNSLNCSVEIATCLTIGTLLLVLNTPVTGGPLATEFLAYTDTLYCTPGRRLERVICVAGRVCCRTVLSVMLVRVTV